MAFVRRDKKGYAVANEDGRPLFQFDLPPSSTPHHRFVLSSVDGLLLLWDGLDDNNDILFVVNPMTREYIDLPPLPARRCLFGFGVSKLSGQYKILCVDESRFCHVYTLGGECSWRRIPAPAAIRLPHALKITYRPSLDYAIFLNGNIHWLACDLENNFLICCFDLETELFTSFPLKDPPLLK
ncbi:uncharacterized protein LOC121790375, partial [Salvia splendens]|uniref:uncharacterized protein LOC121790375 n=1 Tax=Salvia splendens TaxID=180675 RepID=UPI001C27762D